MLTKKDEAAMVNGLLKFAVLVALKEGKKYGIELLDFFTDTPFDTKAGTLYPLLNKLSEERLIDYVWVESPAGPPRKYYSLNTNGAKHLEEIKEFWMKIQKILKG